MNWNKEAQTAAALDKPTEEWELELIGDRAWEVAFISGARWQREQLNVPAHAPTNEEKLRDILWDTTDLDYTSAEVVAQALDANGATAPEEAE